MTVLLPAAMWKNRTLRKVLLILVCTTAVFALVLAFFFMNENVSLKKIPLHIPLIAKAAVKYEPTWKSLDSRPLPPWYDEAKIGIFIHWGVFSVPSYISEWFWYEWKGPKPSASAVQFMQKNYRPDWTYPDFAEEFTAEFFNPDQWAELFRASGAR